MRPSKLPLEPFTAGDHFDGIPTVTITVNGAPPASAMTLVTMRFKKKDFPNGTPVELSSADAEITIESAANWEFSVPEQAIAGLTDGTWTWRISVTDAEGVKKTYLADEITVLETV